MSDEATQPEPVDERDAIIAELPTFDDAPEKVTFQFPMPEKKRVAIVGFATGHSHQAPFDDEETEVWGINRLWKQLPDKRFTRWFELHDLDTFYRTDDEHRAFLKAFQGPVYVREQDYALALEWGIETAQPFPHKVLLDTFWPYFNNTISWLVALAILMNETWPDNRYEWMGLYGVDMAQDHLLQAEYCFGPDVRVLTADLRWVAASAIRLGDKLVGFDEDIPLELRNRQWRTATVQSVQEIIRPCYELTLANGTKMVASKEHRWLTQGKSTQHRWSVTNDLTAPSDNPDRQSGLLQVVDTWTEDRSWEAGYLGAAFDGEGHLSQYRRNNKSGPRGWVTVLGFAQRTNEMSDAVLDAADLLGFRFGKAQLMSGSDTWRFQIAGGRREIMRFLGSVRPRRLLPKFDPDKLGQFTVQDVVKVVQKEYIGDQPVIGIGTDQGTIIAEGIASHNSQQRPSAEYFIGLAAGRGIEIYIPHGSDLMKATHLYGYEDSGPVMEKMGSRFVELGQNKERIRNDLGQLQQQAKVLEGQLSQMDGAMQEITYWRKNWLTLPNTESHPGGDK